MCGQCGIILGRKRRKADEQKMLHDIFTRLLILNEARGKDATGMMTMQRDGLWSLYKENIPVRQFVKSEDFQDTIEGVSDKTTLLAGHARWATVGKASNPRNNHPIMAGHVIGTHNGTITNANEAAKMLRLPRNAKVDSEVIFRIATSVIDKSGYISLDKLKNKLYYLRGEMSAVLVSRTDPSRVLVLKGTKPLHLRYSKKARVIVYSSEDIPLDAVLENTNLKWEKVNLKKNTCMEVYCIKPLQFSMTPFSIQKPLPVYKATTARSYYDFNNEYDYPTSAARFYDGRR